MTVEAIVVTYGSAATIDECVEAALRAGVERVVVWDNGDDVVVRSLPERHGDGVLVAGDGGNHGFGGGVNRALPMITADRVLLLNPDCVLTGPTLERLGEVLEWTGVGAVAPAMEYPDGTRGIAGGPRPTVLKEWLASLGIDGRLPKGLRTRLLRLYGWRPGRRSGRYVDGLDGGEPIEVDWASAYCLLVRTETLLDVGGFDEEYFLYFEDVDLSLRLRAQGLRVLLVRDCVALHYESVSTAPRKKDYYRRGFRTFLAKHGSPRERLTARLTGVAR